jgi:hypothetical protein
MGLKIGDFFEEAGPLGVVAGIGAVILAPVLLPAVAGVGKPLVKSVVKGGITLYERSKGALAEAGESWEDIVAEARAEIAEGKQTAVFESANTTSSETQQNNGEPQA